MFLNSATSKRIAIWLSAAMSSILSVVATAEENHVVWTNLAGEEHFETALDQSWQLPPGSRIDSFQFSAVRFHLGYFELKLLGVADFAKRNPKQIAAPQKVDPGLDSLLDLGLDAIFKARPFENIVALVPAGFPASERQPLNLGLLKIGGVTFSQLLDDGPTAVLCLNSPKFEGHGYQFQLPSFYRTDESRQQDLIRQCKDAVQVGPRIVEDRNSIFKESNEQIQYQRVSNGKTDILPVYLGISVRAAGSRAAYYRTVIALDEPGRLDAKDGDGKSRELARNAYFVVTKTPVTLWEVQSMLVNPRFYSNKQYAPEWSLNLVGGDYAGMIVQRSQEEGPTKVGNTTITQSSVIAVVRK
jgi:hypothetical protein